MKRFFLFWVLSGYIGSLWAAAPAYQTNIHQSDIRTLQVHYANGQTLARPFLILPEQGIIDGSDENNSLVVSFDCMDHEHHYFTYTVYHLNADFTVSSLQSTEYLQGFTTQDITDSELSNNTQQIYTRYSFSFPNDEMRLAASGNYVIHIYEDGATGKSVADVCFQVVEPLVKVEAMVKAATTVEINGRYQQLDINIQTAHLNVQNPDDITVVVQQNNRTDNQVVHPKPTYIEPSRLRFENHPMLVFEGGNEYRHFDIFSVYYAGTGVDRMAYDHNDYHALLEPDDNCGVSVETDKTGTPYIMQDDYNGQFLVNAERTDYADTDAEYVWVHWFLPMREPFLDGVLYVGGDLFLNQFTFRNRMSYDNERRGYYLNALLKQGAYEYQYWFMSKERRLQDATNCPSYEKGATLLRTEGSHWQTKNEYTILVYYRPFGSRADRLVGFKRI